MELKNNMSDENSLSDVTAVEVQPRKRMKREDRDREIAAAAVAFLPRLVLMVIHVS